MLYLPELQQLLSAEVALLFDGFSLVSTPDGLQVRLGVVSVIWWRHKLALTKGRHAAVIRFHVVIFFVRQRSCIEVLDEFGEFLLVLIFRYRFRVYLALFDEPRIEFGAFGKYIRF